MNAREPITPASSTSPHRLREAQALVIFALFSLVLIGSLALAVDAGMLLSERRQVQGSVDAAAMAAAKAALDNKSGSEIIGTGQSYGAFNAGVAPGNVTVSRPPASGAHAGDNNYIQVTITKDVQRYFIDAVYTGAWSVTASAVAGVENEPGDYALIALERTGTDGIYMNGNTGIVITGNNGSAMANSNIRGSNNTNFDTAGSIDANSTIQQGSGWTAPKGIRQYQPEIDDPLLNTPAPPKVGSAKTFPASCEGTISPGWYRNTSCTVANNETLTLSPGLYYFENSSISLQATKSNVECNGCLVYFDSSSTFDPKNGNVDFSAPSSTPYSGGQTGMVFWYARCNTLDLQGNGDIHFEGIFYAPCALALMHGNPSNDTVNGQMIVNQVDVRGTSDLKITYTKYVDTYRPTVFLVE